MEPSFIVSDANGKSASHTPTSGGHQETPHPGESALPKRNKETKPTVNTESVCHDSGIGCDKFSPTKFSEVQPSTPTSITGNITRIHRPPHFCYDITVLSNDRDGAPLAAAEVAEISRAFKNAVNIDTAGASHLQVNNSTVLTAEKSDQLDTVYLIHLHQYRGEAGKDCPKPSKHAWKRVTAEHDDSPTKDWLYLTNLQPLSGGSNDHGIGKTQINGTKHVNLKTTQVFLDKLHEEYQKSKSRLTTGTFRTAVVFTECARISINDLRTMKCWSSEKESSMLQALEDVWAAGTSPLTKAVQGSSRQVLFGNQVYGVATSAKASGLALHNGTKSCLVLSSNEESALKSKGCGKIFFKPILVSDFVSQYFGNPTCVDWKNESHLARLNDMLVGVHIKVFCDRRGKSPMVQKIVSSNAQEISIPASGCYPDSISLADFAARKYGRILQYPQLPCIDIGTGSRHFFLPMELCEILPNQPFTGPPGSVPSTLQQAIVSQYLPPKLVRTDGLVKSLPQDKPYEKVKLDHFRMVFVEVIVVPPGYKSVKDIKRHLPVDEWTAFQDQLGTRFDKRLVDVVKQSKCITLFYKPGTSTVATFKTDILKAGEVDLKKGDVVIACIPGGAYNQDIHNLLRELCDNSLGVYCNIVTAKEVTRRYKSDALNLTSSLVTYTGAIVRKVLAQRKVVAVIAPGFRDCDAFKAHYGGKPMSTTDGLMIGIHVQPLQDVFPNVTNDGQCSSHLVTICSVITNKPEHNFRSSHQIISCKHSSLNKELDCCLAEHFRLHGSKALSTVTNIDVYRSGYLAGDRIQVSGEVDGFSQLVRATHKASFCEVEDIVHLTYVQQPNTDLQEHIVSSQNEINCVVRKSGSSNGADHVALCQIDQPTPGNDDFIDPHGLTQALHKIYIRSQADLNGSMKPRLVTRFTESLAARNMPKELRNTGQTLGLTDIQKRLSHKIEAFANPLPDFEAPGGISVQYVHSQLKKTLLPDIMFLTQKASRRAVSHIKAGSNSVNASGEMIPFMLTPVHENLLDSLYFL